MKAMKDNICVAIRYQHELKRVIELLDTYGQKYESLTIPTYNKAEYLYLQTSLSGDWHLNYCTWEKVRIDIPNFEELLKHES